MQIPLDDDDRPPDFGIVINYKMTKLLKHTYSNTYLYLGIMFVIGSLSEQFVTCQVILSDSFQGLIRKKRNIEKCDRRGN